jgi:hypothetical protein
MKAALGESPQPEALDRAWVEMRGGLGGRTLEIVRCPLMVSGVWRLAVCSLVLRQVLIMSLIS